MDPLTHGMIGLALSSFAGQPVTLDNPLSIGCAIGAMIPDTDSIMRLFFDDAVYLKHHRGFSHSVPMLAVFSILIAGVLSLVFPETGFGMIWFWSFIGALSHTLFDILNSYGAMLFDRKLKLNLFSLYDPVIAAIGLFLIFKRNLTPADHGVALGVFMGYVVIRWLLKKHAHHLIQDHFKEACPKFEVSILPSLTFFYKWDFIMVGQKKTIIGTINPWTQGLRVVRKLDAQCQTMREIFDQTALGTYFNDFSPHLHIEHEEKDGFVHMRIVDLRYFIRNTFLHHATLELDADNHTITASHLHPYHIKKKVAFQEN